MSPGHWPAFSRNSAIPLARLIIASLIYGTPTDDVGHLYNLAHIVDRKLLEPPFFIQTIFGILGGIRPSCSAGCWRSAARSPDLAPQQGSAASDEDRALFSEHFFFGALSPQAFR